MKQATCDLFSADLAKLHRESGSCGQLLALELRSPLCAIFLSLDQVRTKLGLDVPGPLAAHLALVERNAERMTRLLDLLEETAEAKNPA